MGQRINEKQQQITEKQRDAQLIETKIEEYHRVKNYQWYWISNKLLKRM